MAFKVFQNNTALTVEDLNDVLMEQAIMTFADASARDNALPSPNAGMHCHLESTKTTYEYIIGEGWIPLLRGTDATGNPYKPVLVTGAAKATGGQLSYNTDTSILSVGATKVWSADDNNRRIANMYTTANYVTAATGDTYLPRSIWAGTNTLGTGFQTPTNTANTTALHLPTKGLWQVVLNMRGTTTGTGERYATICHITDVNIRYAAENSVGTGSFSFNMVAMIEAAGPMDFRIGTYTAAGAMTVVPTFQETRLMIYRLSAD